LEDLRAREREDWFDPETFWLAWRGQKLVGAVWAKVTDDMGELYVVAVHPAAQGHGLGGALTELALNRLADLGLPRAELYTDADNAAATRTYARAGFAVVARDAQYEVPHDGHARSPHTRPLGVKTTDVPGMVPPCLL
ncbi:MAG: GNAT family N-acetyltransferase, partial [Cellulomonadaceae bacterium]